MARSRRKKPTQGKYTKLIIWIILVSGFVIHEVTKPPKPHRTDSNKTKYQTVKNSSSSAVKRINTQLHEVERLEKEEEFDQAITLIELLAKEVDLSAEFNDAYKAYIWSLKSDLHIRLWQYHDAVAALKNAKPYANPSQMQFINNRSEWLTKALVQANVEREKYIDYIASPDVGPAAIFSGNVGVIHLFVEEKSGQSWGLKQRTVALTAMEKSKAWLKRETSKYGKSVEFTQRVYLVDRNPVIKRLSVGSQQDRYRYSKAIVKVAVKQLGSDSILSFLEKQKVEMRVDEIMLLIHVNKKGRSFAKRCYFKCSDNGEYTYIIAEAMVKQWQDLEYVQAHEALHLFGADDLYSIKKARDYAVHDIMNYQSRYLYANKIEPITAYGIGLIDNMPETPFRIKKIH